MSDHSHAHPDTGAGHDDWFRHDPTEGRPQAEHAAHVNTTAIGLTLLAIVFGVLFTVIVLTMYFVQYAGTRKAMLAEGVKSAEAYMAYRDQTARDLQTFGWADRAAGTVNLPIDRAIEDVIAEYNRDGVQADAEWHGPSFAAPAPAPEHAQATDPKGPPTTVALEGGDPHD